MENSSNKKIPIVLFTGFLGSGKTTLVNHLIKSYPNYKIGIIINEFGEVGVDSDMVESDEEVKVEISNGCACCIVRGDLLKGVDKLLEKQPELDYIFVEASGLAEPGPMVQTFLHNITNDQKTYLDATICTIDTINFVMNWDEFETLQKQISHSDFIVLSKIQEQGSKKAEVAAILQKVKPDIAIVEFDPNNTQSTSILLEHADWDLNKHGMSKEEDAHKHVGRNHVKHHHEHHEHESFDELVYTSIKQLDPHKLDEVIKTPEFKKIIRAKGFLNLSNQPVTMVFQLVGHGRQLSPYPKKHEESKMVMIGQNLDKTKLISELKSCEVN